MTNREFDPDYAFDSEFPITKEAEEFYRELCRNVIHAAKRGGFRVWVHKEFISGSFWSLTRFLKEMRLETWAEEVMQEEIKEIVGPNDMGEGMGPRLQRLIMPGSKFNESGGTFGHV